MNSFLLAGLLIGVWLLVVRRWINCFSVYYANMTAGMTAYTMIFSDIIRAIKSK